jgi:hypothetical protein
MKNKTAYHAPELVRENGKIAKGPRRESNRAEKRIGIEIEFFGTTPEKVINRLREKGLKVANFRGYTHAVIPQWKVTTDVSVTGTGTGERRGLELVSPPLTEAQMDKELFLALEGLNELEAKVDITCGVHVHHEIDDLTVDHVKNIYKLYFKHEHSIQQVMPKSRRRMNDPRYCKGTNREQIERMDALADSIRGIADRMGSRFQTINLQSYIKYGTVEFRQHGGSTDFDKLFNWIKVTQAIVEKAKSSRKIKKENWQNWNLKDISAANRNFIIQLGMKGTEQSAFLLNRKDAFKALNKAEAEMMNNQNELRIRRNA